ncbi:MAG: FtsQ-type POTRA domain-containing protein [Bryobacterales bacterium]|nr:FtsQ-type POTRA domain-containing protein [Bryobacterales bacterium]
MSRKRKDETQQTSRLGPARQSAASVVRFTLLTLIVVVTVFGGGYMAWRFDQFLRDDERFILSSERPGVDTPIELTGVRNASKASILRAFAVDRGRSLYLMNLQDRRKQILGVEWVRDASVRRVWPNRVTVAVQERVPVAVVPFSSTLLIDAEGYLLTPHGKVPPQYPVLNGLRERDGIELRRDRVQRMLVVLQELNAYRKDILALDVGSGENVKLVYQHGATPITLLMGSERYKERLANLLANFDSVRDRLTEDPVLDLRLDERITIIQ